MATKPVLSPIKKLVPLTVEQAERITDFRCAEHIASENEAIRRLIERAPARAPGAEELSVCESFS
jgi:hypothetical protein